MLRVYSILPVIEEAIVFNSAVGQNEIKKVCNVKHEYFKLYSSYLGSRCLVSRSIHSIKYRTHTKANA